MEGLKEVTNALSIFWVAAIFILPVWPLWPPRQPFCLIFAGTAQRSVLHRVPKLAIPLQISWCKIVNT